MQFFKSTGILFGLAFATFAAAAPTNEDSVDARWQCKPVLASCAVNSVCCGDLCVAGVSALNFIVPVPVSSYWSYHITVVHLTWCGTLPRRSPQNSSFWYVNLMTL
jgi:hypothetical protein